jgi:hypothetical protein
MRNSSVLTALVLSGFTLTSRPAAADTPPAPAVSWVEEKFLRDGHVDTHSREAIRMAGAGG